MHLEAVPDARTEGAERFLAELFGPYDAGFIELRCWRAGKKAVNQEWFPVAEWKRAAQSAIQHDERGEDVYVGVLPRDTSRNGKKENVSRAAWIWADIDFKNTPEDTAATALESEPPDVVVHSGGGLHCYWRLSKVIEMDAPLKRRFESSLAQRLEQIGGDPAAKDVSRVLRIPGTRNHKYQPARQVGLLPTVKAAPPELPPLTDADEQAAWELELALAENKPAREYAEMMVWYHGARAVHNTKAVKQWEARLLAWRRDQARKRDGLRMFSPIVNAEVIVVERIPYVPPGEPVIFERAELELLRGEGEDAVRAAWEAKRAFGGKWTGPSEPPADDAYFAPAARLTIPLAIADGEVSHAR